MGASGEVRVTVFPARNVRCLGCVELDCLWSVVAPDHREVFLTLVKNVDGKDDYAEHIKCYTDTHNLINYFK